MNLLETKQAIVSALILNGNGMIDGMIGRDRFVATPFKHQPGYLRMPQRRFAFSVDQSRVSVSQVEAPAGYSGLYGFHKYWGKKPFEPIAFVIEQLSEPGQLVLDPFVGSGVAARESVIRGRRFIGFDINPVAVQLSRLLISPPNYDRLRSAIAEIEVRVSSQINSSYSLDDGLTATHYLWNESGLQQVWVKGGQHRGREERNPTDNDIQLSETFNGYRSQRVRSPRFFSNGRINASTDMSWDSLMTGRAQRNLDLLLEAVEESPLPLRPALQLCLTAASGQMTKMVFAVTGRGKTTGQQSSKTEVGSWVIGYWRPQFHFEVNVWNCFERRCSKLLKSIKSVPKTDNESVTENFDRVLTGEAIACITLGDCQTNLNRLPAESVDLVITDPPHSDRVPYLELSELWNSILNAPVDFDNEIVISNAKERNKGQAQYVKSMQKFFSDSARIISPKGFLVVLFNSKNQDEWAAIRESCHSETEVGSLLRFVGSFPCKYSANSVVQDNRKGAMKTDYVLVFGRADASHDPLFQNGRLTSIPGWTSKPPEYLQGNS